MSYAEIFCDIFARVSVKNNFLKILKFIQVFFLQNQSFFLPNYPFQAFLVSKTYIFIHVKKLAYNGASANSSGGGGQGLSERVR